MLFTVKQEPIKGALHASAKSWVTRSFWSSLGVCLLFNGLLFTWLVLKPGSHNLFVAVDNIGQAIGALLGILICIGSGPWWRGSSRLGSISVTRTAQHWVPLLLGLGIFGEFGGQVIFTYIEQILHQMSPFPSWADAVFLITYPFLLLGILFLPTRSLSGTTRSRIVLDGLMIMIAMITFSWYFLLGPTLLQGNGTSFAKIVGAVYPICDLILILCLLLLFLRSSDSTLRPVVCLLSLAFTIIIITDSIYDYQLLHSAYFTGGLLDIGWPLGYMLIGLAGQTIRLTMTASVLSPSVLPESVPLQLVAEEPPRVPPLWRSLLPYAFVPVVVVFGEFIGQDSVLNSGVLLGGSMLIGLVLLRQVIVIRETIFQNNELRQIQREVSIKNQALNQANAQLQEQAAQVAAAYEQECHLNDLKNQFLLNVSHELRTPLTALYGYAELLSTYHRQFDADKQETLLHKLLERSQELTLLLDTVLDATQVSNQMKLPQLQEISLARLVREVVDRLDPRDVQAYTIQREFGISGYLLVR